MILIALGANLPSRFGAPEETLMAALQAMENDGIRILKSSAIWLTAPVPASDQPWYRNAVVAVETDLGARALFRLLKRIEKDFGRAEAARNAPRVLDLDIIAYHDHILNRADLTVPHPRMHERGFVLFPLEQIAPDWTHPLSGLTLQDLIASLPGDQKASRAA